MTETHFHVVANELVEGKVCTEECPHYTGEGSLFIGQKITVTNPETGESETGYAKIVGTETEAYRSDPIDITIFGHEFVIVEAE